MKVFFRFSIGLCLFFYPALGTGFPADSLYEKLKAREEQKIRQIVAPLLEKYCASNCALLSTNVQVKNPMIAALTPGFDEDNDIPVNPIVESAQLKLLMSDLVPSEDQTKVVQMVENYLSELGYPIAVQKMVSTFLISKESQSRVSQLQNQISKKFMDQMETFVNQFCPKKCLLSDFKIQTRISALPVDRMEPGVHFIQDNVQIELKSIGITLLLDETLPSSERNHLVELAKLKVADYKNAVITGKSITFPTRQDELSGVLNNEQGGRLVGLKNSPYQNSSYQGAQEIQDQKKNSLEKSDNTSKSQEERNVASVQNVKSESTDHVASSEKSNRVERFERVEKIDRVESGDAVTAELKVLKNYALIFVAVLFAVLTFITFVLLRKNSEAPPMRWNDGKKEPSSPEDGVSDSLERASQGSLAGGSQGGRPNQQRFEVERLKDELLNVFIQHPKVTRHVFSMILTENGIEIAAKYLHIFGEHVFLDLLRDASFQSDLSSLAQYYSKASITLDLEEELSLLQRLYQRAVAAKMLVLGNQSSALFDFLSEMDAPQVLELMRGETDVVKAIIMTQCDSQKRSQVFRFLSSDERMLLMGHLSQIDYLPKSYIHNVASALRRKKKDSPKLNTEALPGSEVLVSLLETTGIDLQKVVLKNLESEAPESTRFILTKLVSVDTLRYLRDGQILEVIMSLRNDELLSFLKGTTQELREVILQKAPHDIALELQDELAALTSLSKEVYEIAERKVLNKIKLMANEGSINLLETNERMFADKGASQNKTSDIAINDARLGRERSS